MRLHRSPTILALMEVYNLTILATVSTKTAAVLDSM